MIMCHSQHPALRPAQPSTTANQRRVLRAVNPVAEKNVQPSASRS